MDVVGDDEIARCIVAADNFSESRNGSYLHSNRALESLTAAIEECSKLNNIIRRLMAQHILNAFMLGMKGEPRNNQIRGAAASSVAKALSFIQDWSVRISNSNATEAINEVIEHWNCSFNPNDPIKSIYAPPNSIEVERLLKIKNTMDAADNFAQSRVTSAESSVIQRLISEMKSCNETDVVKHLAQYIGNSIKLAIDLTVNPNCSLREPMELVSAEPVPDEASLYMPNLFSWIMHYCLSTPNVRAIWEVMEIWEAHPLSPKINIFVTWPQTGSRKTEHQCLFPPQNSSIHFRISLNTDRMLKHATSVDTVFHILLNSLENARVKLLPSESSSGLIWCGVSLRADELAKIPEGSKPGIFARQHRYGHVELEFLFSTVVPPSSQAFVMGTRVYWYEHSQVVLIIKPETSRSNLDHYFAKNAVEFYEMKSIPEDIRSFEWPLHYDYDGRWTHPEIVFVRELTIPVIDLKLNFVDHGGSCPSQRQCKDCNSKINSIPSAVTRFKQLLDNEGSVRKAAFLTLFKSAFCEEVYTELSKTQGSGN